MISMHLFIFIYRIKQVIQELRLHDSDLKILDFFWPHVGYNARKKRKSKWKSRKYGWYRQKNVSFNGKGYQCKTPIIDY